MDYTNYTAAELHALVDQGLAAVKTLRERDADYTMTANFVDALQAELDRRYLSIEL